MRYVKSIGVLLMLVVLISCSDVDDNVGDTVEVRRSIVHDVVGIAEGVAEVVFSNEGISSIKGYFDSLRDRMSEDLFNSKFNVDNMDVLDKVSPIYFELRDPSIYHTNIEIGDSITSVIVVVSYSGVVFDIDSFSSAGGSFDDYGIVIMKFDTNSGDILDMDLLM